LETFKDLTELVFNNWTIVGLSNRTNKKNDRYWKCQCNCGYEVITVISERALLTGTSRSCGCLLGKIRPKKIIKEKPKKILKPPKEKLLLKPIDKRLKPPKILKKPKDKLLERLKRTIKLQPLKRLSSIFSGMKQRCYNPNANGYKYYGGKGVVICDEWLNDKKLFYNWAINNGYEDHLTIDRIENDGNYDPDNCRWATWEQQANNKSNTVFYRYRGEIKTSLNWCQDGLTFETLKIYLIYILNKEQFHMNNVEYIPICT